jgi:2C-methyl-D-erythritol 2,4-cyclodiphosphate synthase
LFHLNLDTIGVKFCIEFNHPQGLKGNSDADVILHSITNALCSVTGQNILGAKADELCQQGITAFSKSTQTFACGSSDANITNFNVG